MEPPVPDYYADLGVSQQASTRDIKLAFYKLAKKHHPDKKAPGQSIDAKDFRKVHEAYEYLSDAKKRAAYDSDYFDLRCDWDKFRESQQNQHKYEERRRAEEEERLARERAEKRKKAAEAERIRRMREEKRAAKEKAERERLRQEKIRRAEMRSQEAARKARERQEQAAKERIRREKQEEAERRSREAAHKARMEQEQAALERLRNLQIAERQEAARRRWASMKDEAESPRCKDSQPNGCHHPPFGWPKKNGARRCAFCGELRRKWSFQCPECSASACPSCKAGYCVL
ncbi:DnaJ-domain-containing protein [Hypoxylon sp. FL1284]|nr:DnaJ-domain-containing protein [Hypoxylon sp. FL1284]